MNKVIYETRKRIAYVTLNRPEQKNAIDREMHELLVKVWKDFCDDESADVAILTGAGDAFCAGMDLKTFVPEVVGANADQVRKLLPVGLGGITRGLHRIHKPVIAAPSRSRRWRPGSSLRWRRIYELLPRTQNSDRLKRAEDFITAMVESLASSTWSAWAARWSWC